MDQIGKCPIETEEKKIEKTNQPQNSCECPYDGEMGDTAMMEEIAVGAERERQEPFE
jgi:hypothetical protein